MNRILNIILIIVLVGIAVWVKSHFFPNEKVVTKTVTETVTDTVRRDSIVYSQLPAPDPDTIYLTDTLEIPPDSTLRYEYTRLYNLFYSQYVYTDTLKDDTSAFIAVKDIISKNRFVATRGLTYQNRTPTQINKTIEKHIHNERKLFVGGQFGPSTGQASVMYKDLNDFQYMVGYDFVNPKGLRLGIYVRLW